MAPYYLAGYDGGEATFTGANVARTWEEVTADPSSGRSVVVDQAAALRHVWRFRNELRGGRRLFVRQRVDSDIRPLLPALFGSVVTPAEAPAILPRDQLAEVVSAPNRRDLFIAAGVAPHTVILHRGDLDSLIVPKSWFRPSGTEKPDFNQMAVTDYGQTIRLGAYEASSDAILYEFDRDYRRRVLAGRLRADRSFGGALRRLRIQRAVRRADFPGLSEKAIARIERGEVSNPHPRTLLAIARRLDVAPEDIASY